MKKIILRILAVVLVAALGVGAWLVSLSISNSKAMNAAADRGLALVKEHFEVTEVDCSEFDGMKVMGIMTFHLEQYEVEGLGNLCIIRASGGPMQMLSFCLTSMERDLPLMVVDYMYMLGNRIAYAEVYDLPLEGGDAYQHCVEQLAALDAEFVHLPDTQPAPGWYDDIKPAGSYKKVTSAEDHDILMMMDAYLSAFLEAAKEAPLLEEGQIPAKADVMETYSHRLISEGGISTDAIRDAIGAERTTAFFDQCMFGTGRAD